VVGVDALVAENGDIYPLLEINARFNNSSFQWCLDALLDEEKSFLVSQMPIQLTGPISFNEFYRDWHELIFQSFSDQGIIILNWNSIICMKIFPCRTKLFYAAVSNSSEQCVDLGKKFAEDMSDYFSKRYCKIAS
jgi:hypothetical protein